jgi:cysteine desulfurase
MDLVMPGPVFPEATLAHLGNVLSQSVESIPGVQGVAAKSRRLANTLSFTIEGCDNSALIAALDLEGICVSGGSACSTGALVPSHVLLAMGYSVSEARSFVRVSMGRATTEEEIKTLVRVMPGVIERVRAANIL